MPLLCRVSLKKGALYNYKFIVGLALGQAIIIGAQAVIYFLYYEEKIWNMKKVTETEKRKIYLYKKISQLKKNANKETNKTKKKQLNREIKKLQDSLPNIRKKVYEREKRKSNPVKEERERQEQIRKKEAAFRERLIREDLERRKNRKLLVTMKDTDRSDRVCPSCGVPYNTSSGFSRCRCS